VAKATLSDADMETAAATPPTADVPSLCAIALNEMPEGKWFLNGSALPAGSSLFQTSACAGGAYGKQAVNSL